MSSLFTSFGINGSLKEMGHENSPSTDNLLYASDLARLLGKSERQARRILSAWEKAYPNQVVGNNAGRRFVTYESLGRIAGDVTLKYAKQILERVDNIDNRVRALEKVLVTRIAKST